MKQYFYVLAIILALLAGKTMSVASTVPKVVKTRTTKQLSGSNKSKRSAASDNGGSLSKGKLSHGYANYVFQEGINSFYVTEDNIYIVENIPYYGNINNAVYAINTITGRVKTVVNGIHGIFEGARQFRVFGVQERKGNLYLYGYDRTKVSGAYSSEDCDWILFDPNTQKFGSPIFPNYKVTSLVHDASNRSQYETFSSSRNRNVAILLDFATNKSTTLNNYYENHFGEEHIKIDRYGTQWNFTSNSINVDGEIDKWVRGLYYITKDGKESILRLKDLEYVKNEKPQVETVRLYMCGDNLYFNYGRRIYRVDTSVGPGNYKITEYAKIPPSMSGSFNEKFAVSTEGCILGDWGWDLIYFTPSNLSNPKIIKRSTGNEADKKASSVIGYSKLISDINGNFVFIGSSEIIIYNPTGSINGYVAGQGKTTTIGPK